MSAAVGTDRDISRLHQPATSVGPALVLSKQAAAAYRPDVDGLRAVAIGSVLLFHLAPHLLPGGFVGVDIFFVISGFLISGLIFKGLAAGCFSFIDFYARRIRRIFPALTAVLLAVWLLGWLKLLPDEYRSLTKHIAAGSVYLSNVLLFKESGYFDLTATSKPLLHLWSLGVEEQFYILWPLVLSVTWRARRVWPWLALLALLSFSYNLWAVQQHAAAAFFLPQARLWELAAGGMLARVQMTPPGTTVGPIERVSAARDLASIAGLMLLLLSFLVIDRTRPFPGLWALLPVGGTLLMIGAGERAWVNRRLLASRGMVFIGLISYPLYLWHWPLLSLAHILSPQGVTPQVLALAAAMAFLLAWLTYRSIEMPIRAAGSLREVAAILLAGLVVLGGLGCAAYWRQWQPLAGRYDVARIVAASSEMAFSGNHLERTQEGFYLQRAAQREILLIGDSNAEQYYPRIDQLLREDPRHNMTAVFATGGGCPPIPAVAEDHHRGCAAVLPKAIAYALRPSVDSIVIAAAWSGYFDAQDERYSYYLLENGVRARLANNPRVQQEALAGLERMIAGFVAEHKRVSLVLQIPGGDGADPKAMIRRGWMTSGFTISAVALRKQDVYREVGALDAQLRAIARRHGVQVIDPLDYLCNASQCPVIEVDGEPIYRDPGHLRPSYVRREVHFLDELLRLPAT